MFIIEYRQTLVWYVIKTLLENQKVPENNVDIVNESTPPAGEINVLPNNLDIVQPLKASSSIGKSLL